MKGHRDVSEMNTTKDKILTYALTPMSWLYGAATWVRNKAFDLGVLKEEKFDVPVVRIYRKQSGDGYEHSCPEPWL